MKELANEMEAIFLVLWFAHAFIFQTLVNCATVRSFPNYDYGTYNSNLDSHLQANLQMITFELAGGKEHNQFLTDVLKRGSPEANRLLAELFGGLELGLEFSDKQAIIIVGGATTRCQHQSPCYDSTCKACYDPLLRYVEVPFLIH